MPSHQSPGRSTLERALHALERLETKLAAAERSKSEPIAIVGVGCRFPGGARDLEGYWQVLRVGSSMVSEIPKERWAHSNVVLDASARWAGLISDVDEFDGLFFGFSRQEIADMDPQHRLLLEAAWEAIEHGAIKLDRLSQNRTGVFLGISAHEYLNVLNTSGAEPRPYIITGNSAAFAASRMAHYFGLHGPCLTIDTACSSSLVALHLACQSLRRGECDMALVGAANLLLAPETSELLGSLNILSRDGVCRTFDARADGYVRAEGIGVLVLERLSDAQTRDDQIFAQIRGSAVNHNGRATSPTAPSVQAQAAVIRAALADARVTPDQIGYVETHSNGSPIGDAVEIDALREVLGQQRKDGSICVLGSAKTCIGHAEAASGIASIAKALLVLNHETIPKNLHFESLNTNTSIDGTPFVIPTSDVVWKRGNSPRIVGVSATGLSGTNAHVVLEEAPAAMRPKGMPERSSHLYVLSGKTLAALRDQAKQMLRHATAHPESSLGDRCHTLGAGRAHFEHRFAAVVGSNAELIGQLGDFIDGASSAYLTGRVQSLSARRRMGFLFSGSGADVAGVLDSPHSAPIEFLEACQQADNAILTLTGQQVASHPPYDSGVQALSAYVQGELALFTLQYALTELWRAWGFEPVVAAGEGTGECVAAWAVGALEFLDALHLVIARAIWIDGGRKDTKSFSRVLSRLRVTVPKHTFHSSVDAMFSVSSLKSIEYWERQAITSEPWDSIFGRISAQACDLHIEIGPRQKIHAPQKAGNPKPVLVIPSVHASQTSLRAFQQVLARLYIAGFELQWPLIDARHPYRRIPLPTYPFQRQRYWFGKPTTSTTTSMDADGHWLLGRVLEPFADRPDTRIWERTIDETNGQSLGLQDIAGVSFLASGAIAELAAAAAREIFGKTPWELRLALSDPPAIDSTATIQVIVGHRNDSASTVEVFFRGRSGTAWKRLANGIAETAKLADDVDEVAPPSIRTGRRQSLPLVLWQRRFETLGVQTESFSIEQIWRREAETLARVQLKGLQSAASVVRVVVAIVSITHPGVHGRWWIVEAVEGLTIRETSAEGTAWLRINWNTNDGFSARIGVELVDEDGSVIAAGRQIDLRAQDNAALLRALNRDPIETAFVDKTWVELPQPSAISIQRKWLVITDDGGVGAALAAQLRAAGHLVYTLSAVDLLGPGEKLELILLLSGPFFGVVYLGALDSQIGMAATTVAVDRELSTQLAAVLRIAQGLAGLTQMPRLWLATSGAQPVGNVQVPMAHASLWGLGRVLAMERPDMWGGLIDIDPQISPDNIAEVAALLSACKSGSQIVQRDGKLYAPRFERISLLDEHLLEVRPDRTYLVTGADTLLGVEVVRWLVERGAKHFVFADSNGASRANGETIEAHSNLSTILRGLPAQRMAFDAVNEDIAEMRQRLAAITPALGGVFHAAYAMDNRAQRLSANGALATIQRDFCEKVSGLWLLHQATIELPLDVFLILTSLPSALGWEGFATDTMATECANAISRFQCKVGRRAATIHIAFPNEPRPGNTELEQELLSAGFQGMSAGFSLNAIERALSTEHPVGTLVWADWDLFESSERADSLRPFLQNIIRGRNTRVGPAVLKRRILAAEPEEAQRLVRQIVRNEVAHVLGTTSEIESNKDFVSLGMDSIMGVQVLTRVGRACGIVLSTSNLLDRLNIDTLTLKVLHAIRPDDPLSERSEGTAVIRRGLFIEFRSEHSKQPFFMLPPLTGSGMVFQPIVKEVTGTRPFCTFNAPGLDADTMPCERVEVLAAHFIHELRRRQPRGPYLLGGYSFGVLVAYELAQMLIRAGERVDTLVLVDMPPSRHKQARLSPLSQLARLFYHAIDDPEFDNLDPEEQAARMTSSTGSKLQLPPDIGESGQQLRVYQAHLRALQAYTPQPYSGQISLIRSQETIQNAQAAGITPDDPSLGWNSLCQSPVHVYNVPGDHFSLLFAPEFTKALQTILEQADST